MPRSLLIHDRSFLAIMFIGGFRITFRHITCCILLLQALLWCDTSVPLPRSNIGDAHKMIHEGKVPKLGCLMLAMNRFEISLDDGKLDDTRSDYLVALQDSFLPVRWSASFHVEPYSPIGSIDNSASVSKSLGTSGGSSLPSSIIWGRPLLLEEASILR